VAFLGAIACSAACGGGGGSDRGGAPDGGAGSSTAGESDAPPEFPAGVYACSSSMNASGSFQGTNFESVGGGNGTLTITQSGWVVTAAYTGDTFVQGSLEFVVTTEASAVPASPGQTVTIDCFVPLGPSEQQPLDLPLEVASGALTMDGSTVFLSFSGLAGAAGTGTSTGAPAGGSPCDGLEIPVTLTCSAAAAGDQ
jgi:hypothetical protein